MFCINLYLYIDASVRSCGTMVRETILKQPYNYMKESGLKRPSNDQYQYRLSYRDGTTEEKDPYGLQLLVEDRFQININLNKEMKFKYTQLLLFM